MVAAVEVNGPVVYDFARMATTLAGRFPKGEAREWLEQSWLEPEGYRSALYENARRTLLGFSSRLDATIDVYHDLIEVHLGLGRSAWCYSENGQDLCSLSYDALHAASVTLADVWRARGATAGQSLTVLGVPGPDRVVALLAGLYLGLQVSLVEPRGRRYVATRLRLLAADYVAAQNDSLVWYAAEGVALPLTAGALGGASSLETCHRYGPEDPMLAFASPLAEGEESVAVLSASACMTSLLSDVQLLFPIHVGERVAAVGRDRGLVEPTLWLATFLVGGTYVDLDLQACKDNPNLLARAEIELMLPGASLLDTLLRNPVELTASWKRWSLDPSGKLEWQRWWTLAEELKARGVPGFNAIYLAPMGGSLAISPKVLRPDPMRVVPAPGLVWALHDVTGVGAPVPVDSGLLAVEGLSKAQVGDLMVAGAELAYGLAGSLRPRINGCPYPEREVVELVQEHHAVLHAAVVVIADRAIMNHGSARLLLFVDPLWAGSHSSGLALLCEFLKNQVHEEIGSAAQLDRVEAFALCPRLREEQMDPVWVTGQYVSGMLYKKQPMASFRVLAKLRRLFSADESVPRIE